MENLKEITSHFKLEGSVQDIAPLGTGLINDSYRVNTQEVHTPDYVLQRINHDIFTDVDMLQNNIIAVTSHIRKKLEEKKESDIGRKVLTYIPSLDGRYYYFDGNNYWRMMIFIPGAKTYEAVTPEFSYFAGLAFGDFQSMLSDIPVKLGETIPDFHNMEFRLFQLREAVKKDLAGRLKGVLYYVDEIEKRAQDMCLAEQLHREGKLPKRVCHCDTKVNNMMFDADGKVLCVIDLDTVMPSYIFSDYGDFLRTGANMGEEDDKDLDKVAFNMEIFKAFTRGYLQAAKVFLTPVETENLPYAAALFPYMQCVRFLTDYINGDIYYKIKYPDHNLVRTKAQFKLWQSVESRHKEMKEFIERCLD